MSLLKYNNYIKCISESNSYFKFENLVSNLKTNKEKGDIQEIFAKVYFESHSKHYNIKNYYSRLTDTIPDNLEVNKNDVGTDAIIEHSDGMISLVQVKYRSNNASMLRTYISNMSLEAITLKDRFRMMYLFSNTHKQPKNINNKENERIIYILGNTLIECNWDLIRLYANSLICGVVKECKVLIPKLRVWQNEAIDFVFKSGTNFGRKQVIAACGAGKTVFAHEIINRFDENKGELAYKKVLVLVPTLHLLSQWFERMASWSPERNYCLVGSDLDTDNIKEITFELTTDSDNIETSKADVYISTYHSLEKILNTDLNFDLVICDEAHQCCGRTLKSGKLSFASVNSRFSRPVLENFPANNRLFMTATPKVYKGDKKEYTMSMNDFDLFGERYTYSFAKAIKEKIISDYKIIVGYGNTEYRYEHFNASFIKKSMLERNIKSLLVFSSNHTQSKKLYDEVVKLFNDENEEYEEDDYEELKDIKLCLMPSGANSKHKGEAIRYLSDTKRSIVFNVRVFGVGSDIPNLEAVMINGNKNSVIDIVQSVSRCLRINSNKDYAKILIPCIVETEDLDGPGTFMALRKFISAMGSIDSALVQSVILRSENKSESKIIIDNVFDIRENNEIERLSLSDFKIKMFDRLKNTRGFSESYRFELLKRYCIENNKLPLRKEEYNDIKIGGFLSRLLNGRNYKNDRDKWLGELKSISNNLKKEIEQIIKKYKMTEEQHLDYLNTSTLETTFDNLKLWCEKYDRLPELDILYDSNQREGFLSRLLNGRNYKNDRDQQLEELKSISNNLKKEIEQTIEKYRMTEEQQHLDYLNESSIETKFDNLKLWCEKYDRLPGLDMLYDCNTREGFLSRLLNGRNYKNDRDRWLDELKSISNNLKKEIEQKSKQTFGQIKGELYHINKNTSTLETKFDNLKLWCEEYDRLPESYVEHNNNLIGEFLNMLLNGRKYKNDRDRWLDELKSISNKLKEEIEKTIKQNCLNKIQWKKNKKNIYKSFYFFN